ncbi:MAG: hypothetical protein AB1Z23_02255 [Eubacteriales bacterium]
MERLSTSMGTKEQKPNIDLAIKLATTKDKKTIGEIAQNLHNNDKLIASDCVKVMYEIGSIEPELIAGYGDEFLELISSNNNRMVWGAMYALAQIAPIRTQFIDENFEKIEEAYKEGSVITIDSCIVIFAHIAKADADNSQKAFDLIINHLKSCRAKDIPQHSEKAFVCINGSNYTEFENILKDRFDEMSTSQQRRVARVLQKIEKREFE